MPLGGFYETAAGGPATRKRTHAQITRSQSGSTTPPPSKRRRPNTTRPSPSPFSETPSRAGSPVPRFVGDGLDFRRPTTSAMEQAQEQTTIDLTLDDESDPDEADGSGPPSPSHHPIDRLRSRPQQAAGLSATNISEAGSVRMQADHAPEREVIDLSSSDNEDNDDLQIVGERQIPRRPVLPIPGDINRRLRTPPPELRRANAQTFADTLRQLPGFFGLARQAPTQNVPFPGLGMLDQARAVLQSRMVPEPLNLGLYDVDGLTDYDNIEMNYGAPAFEIVDPEEEDTPLDDYKPLPAVKEGFTRDVDEEGDVLVCVACEDELATGDNEVKQQVWVSRRCGHVYCGACASRRRVSRKGNDRDRKRARQPAFDSLIDCKAEGCNTKVGSGKTAMFQVYL